MKVKFFLKKGWESSPFCEIVDEKNYDDNYYYLAYCTWEMTNMIDIDYEMNGIKKVENNEIEFFHTGTDIFDVFVYKDRVEFESTLKGDDKWDNWSCTLEEYKRVFFAKKVFLMLPKELESYLEIKINDL